MINTALWLNAFYALLTAASVWVGLISIQQVLQFFGRDKATLPTEEQSPKEVKLEGTLTQTDKP